MNNIIYRTLFGSHLYGTNTPASDEDWKSVRLPSAREILLGKGKETTNIKDRYVKAEGEKNLPGEYEEECFTLRQYLKLVSEGQTVSLDMLFAPFEFHDTSIYPSVYLTGDNKKRDIWNNIIANRHRLISKKSGAFVGYCRQQAKKYGIKGSRVAAVRAVLAFLKGEHDGFIDPNKKLEEYDVGLRFYFSKMEHIEFTSITQASGTKIDYLDVCGRKLQYTSKVSECIKVVQHLMDEYGHRALQAESNEGIDWKALSHAVRIGEQAIELFETGKIIFPRHNANFLKEIKQGKLPYKEVAEIIERNFDEVEKASAKSSLPNDVDHDWIENFIYEQYEKVVVNENETNRYFDYDYTHGIK